MLLKSKTKSKRREEEVGRKFEKTLVSAAADDPNLDDATFRVSAHVHASNPAYAGMLSA